MSLFLPTPSTSPCSLFVYFTCGSSRRRGLVLCGIPSTWVDEGGKPRPHRNGEDGWGRRPEGPEGTTEQSPRTHLSGFWYSLTQMPIQFCEKLGGGTLLLSLRGGGTCLPMPTWPVGPFAPLQVEAPSAMGWLTGVIHRACCLGWRRSFQTIATSVQRSSEEDGRHKQMILIQNTVLHLRCGWTWSDWEPTGWAGKA